MPDSLQGHALFEDTLNFNKEKIKRKKIYLCLKHNFKMYAINYKVIHRG